MFGSNRLANSCPGGARVRIVYIVKASRSDQELECSKVFEKLGQ